MGLVIECECGAVVRGDSEDALVAATEQHIESEHRAAAGAATRDDLLAMSHPEKEDG